MDGRFTRRGIALLGVGAAGTLAACASGEPAPRGAGGGLKGTVTLYGWDQEPISGTRRRAMDGFRAQHPPLTVEQETTSAGGNAYFDKLQTLIAGGPPRTCSSSRTPGSHSS